MRSNYNKMFNDSKTETAKEEPKPNTLVEDTSDVKTEKPTTHKKIKAVVVNCKKLNVRKSPNKDSEILCMINEGTIVTIHPVKNVDVDDNWASVKLKDGTQGYVMCQFIKEV